MSICVSDCSCSTIKLSIITYDIYTSPDSKVHGANMGPIGGQQGPGGPQVGPMNFAIWEHIRLTSIGVRTNNYIHVKQWDVIIHPCSNVNDGWNKWPSNFPNDYIPYKAMDAISLSLCMLVTGAPGADDETNKNVIESALFSQCPCIVEKSFLPILWFYSEYSRFFLNRIG